MGAQDEAHSGFHGDIQCRAAGLAYDRIDEAIAREKALKKWRRDWKINLIEDMNPDWTDLYAVLTNNVIPGRAKARTRNP